MAVPPFPGNDVGAWLTACSVTGDNRTAAWVIGGVPNELMAAHLDHALSEPRGARVAFLLVAAGVVSPTAVFCVATEAAIVLVASTGPDWDAVDANNRTALHTAAKRGVDKPAYAALLAHARPSLNVLDGDSQTALAIAMQHGNLGAAEALLDAGAEVTGIGLVATAAMASLLVAHDQVPTAADFKLLRKRRSQPVARSRRSRLPDALDKKAVASHRAEQQGAIGAKRANLAAIHDVFACAVAARAALNACLEQYDE